MNTKENRKGIVKAAIVAIIFIVAYVALCVVVNATETTTSLPVKTASEGEKTMNATVSFASYLGVYMFIGMMALGAAAMAVTVVVKNLPYRQERK